MKKSKSVIWVVVNSNSVKEADKIGKAILKERLCACYGIIPRIKSVYYWPPLSAKLEMSKGPLLTLETLPKNYLKITALVKKLHTDKVPFVGQFEFKNIESNFYSWLKNEIKK